MRQKMHTPEEARLRKFSEKFMLSVSPHLVPPLRWVVRQLQLKTGSSDRWGGPRACVGLSADPTPDFHLFVEP